MRPLLTPGARGLVTEVVRFHNATSTPYQASLVFDCSHLPKRVRLLVRLPAALDVGTAVHATPRPSTPADPSPPMPMADTVYEVVPASRAALSVPMTSLAEVPAFLALQADGPLPEDGLWPLEVQQWRGGAPHPSHGGHGSEKLVGGCTLLVVTKPGDPPPPAEEFEEERRIPLVPSWLADANQDRWQEMFGATGAGGGVLADPPTVTNDRGDFTGSCPVTVTFTATLRSGQGGIVHYLWLRSDGALAPIQQAELGARETREITTTWTLGTPGMGYDGWQALRVLGDQVIDSAPSHFSIRCT
jgi:hypothetical protein